MISDQGKDLDQWYGRPSSFEIALLVVLTRFEMLFFSHKLESLQFLQSINNSIRRKDF